MNSFTKPALLLFAALPGIAAAQENCTENDGFARVQIRYVGNDADREKDWGYVYGKFVLVNGSEKTLRFASYEGDKQPIVLYPLDFSLEKQSTVGSWSYDVLTLDHPRPSTSVITVRPGQEVTLLGESREGAQNKYRAKVRQPRGCWITSEPFTFPDAPHSASQRMDP